MHRLPAASELHAELAKIDPVDRSWSTTDYLLAHLVDLLQVGNYQFALVHSKHRPAQKPRPLPRPRDAHKPRQSRQWMGRTLYTPKEQ